MEYFNLKLIIILILVAGISSLMITACDDSVNSNDTEEVDSNNSCDSNSSAYAPASVICNSVSPHCPNEFPYTCGDSTRCFRFETDCNAAGECCPLTNSNNVNPDNWVPKN